MAAVAVAVAVAVAAAASLLEVFRVFVIALSVIEYVGYVEPVQNPIWLPARTMPSILIERDMYPLWNWYKILRVGFHICVDQLRETPTDCVQLRPHETSHL